MTSNDPDQPPSHSRSRRWDAPVLIALASVLIALVYNGIQVRNSAHQLRQSQRSLELSSRADAFATLMQMHDRVVRADAATTKAILRTEAFRRSHKDRFDDATANAEGVNVAAVVNAITPLEAVVYALSHRVVPLAGAERLWTSYLVCDYLSAAKTVGPTLAAYVPQLARFAAQHPGRRRCVAAVVG
jgi:hypothetical protein